MAKTILVLMDGCRYDAITQTGGYFEHLIDRGLGAKYKVRGELPSMSRPMYETLMTGLPSSVHGVVNNQVVRPSRFENLFSLCKHNGLTTAAAAYFWFSELYSRAPFCPHRDRMQLAGAGSIDHGIFYYEDHYPDSHLYNDGEFLRETYNPDFILFHSMNIDCWGHRKGGESPEYLGAVAAAQELLSPLLHRWLEEGCNVIITADHGMSSFGMHGGPTAQQRTVALYLFSRGLQCGRFTENEISQLSLAPLVCSLLGIAPAQGMTHTGQIARIGESNEKQ